MTLPEFGEMATPIHQKVTVTLDNPGFYPPLFWQFIARAVVGAFQSEERIELLGDESNGIEGWFKRVGLFRREFIITFEILNSMNFLQDPYPRDAVTKLMRDLWVRRFMVDLEHVNEQ